jgi:hypothetical protein
MGINGHFIGLTILRKVLNAFEELQITDPHL